MTKRSTSVSHEDDWIIHVLVILSIFIEILIDALRCLTSTNSASPTHVLGSADLQSKDIKSTKSGSTKTQRLSPSTKRRSTTAVQRKVGGGTTQDSQSLPTASSPRGRRSKPSSNTSTSTKSQSSQALASRRPTTTTKSTSPMTSLSSTPHLNHTTADDCNSDSTSWIEHQSTESVRILPEPQEEAQEHTVLRTKVPRSKLKA